VVFFGVTIFLGSLYTSAYSFGVVDSLRWVKQRIVGPRVTAGHVTRSVAAPNEQEDLMPPIEPVKYEGRIVTFENNIMQCFEDIKDNPMYADAPALINPTIVVNGQEVAPDVQAQIMTDNGKGFIIIRLYKACAKQIYAMQQGPLRTVLMKLLKYTMEPWLQWQYKVRFDVHDLEYVQLSDLVLNAYQRAIEHNAAVNHSFKWILLVELSLNETIEL
jgi:hypothetical protein